ncbi:MAG: LysM peptidoglycan-binding domain-containing protein [Deltaproteobacteria bacterium]|nr:LysM peptidoglycan-binding domain-containing protein [Deltaproteobacteria bacterium]
MIIKLRVDNNSLALQLRSLDSRLKKVEEKSYRLDEKSYRLDWLDARLAEIEAKNKEFSLFMEMFEKLDSGNKATTATKPQPLTPAKSPSRRYHKVRPGETLYGISKRYGLSVDEIRRLNKLEPGAAIHPGQLLAVGSQGKK